MAAQPRRRNIAGQIRSATHRISLCGERLGFTIPDDDTVRWKLHSVRGTGGAILACTAGYTGLFPRDFSVTGLELEMDDEVLTVPRDARLEGEDPGAKYFLDELLSLRRALRLAPESIRPVGSCTGRL